MQLSKDTPILLVHGIFDDATVFKHLVDFLRDNGWTPHAISLKPSNGDLPLNKLAEQIADYEATHLPQDKRFILIGFSMGGVVCRYYLQRLGGLQRVRKFISIASPHRGSLLAYFNFKPGGRQLRPNSDFLLDLNRDAHVLNNVEHVSIWTPFDLMILPYTSSVIDHGENKRVPVLVHAWMLSDERCFNEVKSILERAYAQA